MNNLLSKKYKQIFLFYFNIKVMVQPDLCLKILSIVFSNYTHSFHNVDERIIPRQVVSYISADFKLSLEFIWQKYIFYCFINAFTWYLWLIVLSSLVFPFHCTLFSSIKTRMCRSESTVYAIIYIILNKFLFTL